MPGQGRHVERGPYLGPSAPNRALAPGPVAVEGPLPPRPDLLAVETPTRAGWQEGGAHNGSHSRGALEEIVLLPPQGLPRSSGRSPSVSLRLRSSHLMWERFPRTALADPSRLFLRRQHLDDLAAPSQRPTAPLFSGRGRGTDHPASGPDLGVEGVRLGESAGPGKTRTCRGFTTATGMPPRPALPPRASPPRWLPRQRERAPKLEGATRGRPTSWGTPRLRPGRTATSNWVYTSPRFAHRFLPCWPVLAECGLFAAHATVRACEGSAWRPNPPRSHTTQDMTICHAWLKNASIVYDPVPLDKIRGLLY